MLAKNKPDVIETKTETPIFMSGFPGLVAVPLEEINDGRCGKRGWISV